MNDLGLDEPIKESEKTVERDREEEEEAEFDDEQTFLDPRLALSDYAYGVENANVIIIVAGGLLRRPFLCSRYAPRVLPWSGHY